MKKIVIALTTLIAVIAIFFGIYLSQKPDTVAGNKTIHVEVIHGDGTSKTFDYSTDHEYLGPVITESGLVVGEQGDYGIYIKSVDGEKVDEANQEWWCLTKDGGEVYTSADQTPIADGDKYELTLMIGY